MFWLLLSSSCTESRALLFLTPPQRRVGWGCTRSREGTQLGQLTPPDQRVILDHLMSCSAMQLGVDVVNDFMDPNLVLDQKHFIAQMNTLYTNTIVTRANQLWIRGFASASSRLLFSGIFCSWMCENNLSHENREGRHRMH